MTYNNSSRDHFGNPTWRTYLLVAAIVVMLPVLVPIAVIGDLLHRAFRKPVPDEQKEWDRYYYGYDHHECAGVKGR